MEGVSPIDEKKMTGTQQRIIDAALHLISQVGYKSTTTKLIAQEAEVNETTILKIQIKRSFNECSLQTTCESN
ncbi:hypothetical protein BN1423_1350018 [Carnobacterium maltaromaticum]|nr:hypothetical protein BN1423_1350018 [Carnobacterium maltaromaticum]